MCVCDAHSTTIILQPELNGQVAPQLRGIDHISMVDIVDKSRTDCAEPNVWIDDGSITGPFVKVKICSRVGCPLDSYVYFYT